LIAKHFDLRPAAIIRDLDLLRPIYRQVAAYAISADPISTCPGNGLTKPPHCVPMPESEAPPRPVEEIIFENEVSGYKVLAISGTENFIPLASSPVSRQANWLN
jgi:hypothetical protein